MIRKLLASAGLAFAVVLGAAATAPSVHAQARLESGEASYVKADETVDGSAYLTGNSIRMEGTVNGDLYCAGKDVVVSGTVNGDVICVGMTLTVGGKVTGNVRLAGSSVTVSSDVAGNATIFGGTVTLESAAKIGKDATLGGSDVLVNGSVGRDLVGGGSNVTLNSQVGRDVHGEYETLAIGKDATVGGFVHYASTKDATVDGKVNGGVQRSEPSDYKGERAVSKGDIFSAMLMMLGWILVTALALLLVLPKKMRTVTNLAGRQAALVTALGFMSVIALPVLAAILAMTVIGLPLAMIVLLVWLLLLATSMGVAAIYLGRLLFGKYNLHPLAATALGGLVIAALALIPLLNIIAFVLAISFGVGAVLYAVRGEFEPDDCTRSKPKAKLAKA